MNKFFLPLLLVMLWLCPGFAGIKRPLYKSCIISIAPVKEAIRCVTCCSQTKCRTKAGKTADAKHNHVIAGPQAKGAGASLKQVIVIK